MRTVMFPDPVREVITYLARHIDADFSQEPRPDDHRGLYVQVVDGGGTHYEKVMDDARVIVEVSHEDSVVASEQARVCDALLRAYATSVGRWLATVSRPHYEPDPDMRVPVYQLTHTLRFRGVEVDVP